MAKLMVVDDEPAILAAFRRAFRGSDLQVVTFDSAREALEAARADLPDVIVMDIQLPALSGLEALPRFREIDPRTPIILMSGKSTTDAAIEAMRQGAHDYLLKPLELSELRQVIDKALSLSRLRHVRAVLAESEKHEDRDDAIIGHCPAMQAVYKAIGRVADQDVTVLITGESGTGKELVARAIYQHGRRSRGPFLAINCAALPDNLLESELFGFEPGAFTGAERRRIGKFEQCSGGTIFLDEVGDMSPATQSKILRILQEQTFERLGGNDTIRSDVRILAATNHDLAALVEQGRFRQDLFYRLNVFTIHLPPLRERGDDLVLLAQHYLRRFSRELGREIEGIDKEALDCLCRFTWPGNVRELQSVLKQAILQASGTVLVRDFLPAAIINPESRAPAGDYAAQPRLEQFIDEQLQSGASNLYDSAIRRVERILLTKVLQHTGGNQVQAARILGITRGSVRLKLRELGITIGRTVSGNEDDDE